MRVKRAPSCLLLLAPLLAGGCGDDPVRPGPDVGSFHATIVGDLSATISGAAVFGFTSTTFVIALTSADGRYAFVVSRAGARPSTGQFDVGAGDDEFTAAITFDPTPANDASGDERVFVPLDTGGGRVVLTTSTAGQVSGTLTIHAFDAEEETRTITVESTFSARCLGDGGGSCTP